MTPTEFGKMCLKIIREVEAPATLAASTNSLSRRERNSALTKRARPVQAINPRSSPRAIALPPNVLPNTAPSTRVGMMMITSVNLIRSESTRPRRKPETAPTTTPMTVEMKPTKRITVSDCWMPRITRAKMSLPNVSCPKGCSPMVKGQSEKVGAPPGFRTS